MESEDNEDDSENSGNNSESSENNSRNNSGNNSDYYKNLVDVSKELLEKIRKNDENKKYTSADEVLKSLNARAEDNRKINEIPKKYYAEEACRTSAKVENFNKMII